MKVLLTILYTLFSYSLLAQTTKHTWLVGGNAHVRYETSSLPTWNLDLNPTIGYFVKSNIALGISSPIIISSQKSTSASGLVGFVDGQQVEINRIAQSTIGLAPFIRGYIGSGKFRPFLQAQTGLARGNYKVVYRTIPQRKEIAYKAIVSGSVGVSYFIKEYIGIEALINGIYNQDNFRHFPPTSIGLYLGVQVYLPKRSTKL